MFGIFQSQVLKPSVYFPDFSTLSHLLGQEKTLTNGVGRMGPKKNYVRLVLFLRSFEMLFQTMSCRCLRIRPVIALKILVYDLFFLYCS